MKEVLPAAVGRCHLGRFMSPQHLTVDEGQLILVH